MPVENGKVNADAQKHVYVWFQTFCQKPIGNLNTDKIFNQDIWMEFEIEKCTMLVMNKGKVKKLKE